MGSGDSCALISEFYFTNVDSYGWFGRAFMFCPVVDVAGHNIAGIAVGLKNWLRVTFAIEPSSLEEGLNRIKAFCERHAKKQ